jgi:hypothetical protein
MCEAGHVYVVRELGMHGAVPPLQYVFMPVLLNQAQGRVCPVVVSKVLGCEDYVEKALFNSYLWCLCFLILTFCGSYIKDLKRKFFFLQNLYLFRQFI